MTVFAALAHVSSRLLVEQTGWSLSVLNDVWALALCEQHAEARLAYDELVETARRAGSPIVFALVSSRRSQLHYQRGEIPDAIRHSQYGLTNAYIMYRKL